MAKYTSELIDLEMMSGVSGNKGTVVEIHRDEQKRNVERISKKLKESPPVEEIKCEEELNDLQSDVKQLNDAFITLSRKRQLTIDFYLQRFVSSLSVLFLTPL